MLPYWLLLSKLTKCEHYGDGFSLNWKYLQLLNDAYANISQDVVRLNIGCSVYLDEPNTTLHNQYFTTAERANQRNLGKR